MDVNKVIIGSFHTVGETENLNFIQIRNKTKRIAYLYLFNLCKCAIGTIKNNIHSFRHLLVHYFVDVDKTETTV